MRERGGRLLPLVVRNEGHAVPYIRDHVGTLATIHADEGTGWDALHAGWDTRRVKPSFAELVTASRTIPTPLSTPDYTRPSKR